MMARFGQVFYGFTAIFAILVIGMALYGLIFGAREADHFFQIFAIVLALGAWLIGRAGRYILAGY